MKTFAVIGMGRFGKSIALQLFKMGYEVLAVDKDIDKINAVADYVTQAVCADAKEESVLKSLGIRNYDCVVIAIGGNISDSVLITLNVKESGIKQIVCKALDRQHKKVLEKIGADTVIIPEQEAGIKIAINLVSERIIDMIDISDKYSIADIIVPKRWVGKSIEELSVRKKHGVNIVAIKTNLSDNEVTITPKPDYIFKGTDIVVLVGETESINTLDKM
ncbi:MAG: TrkA family potassium uptake protein [Clostridia bacterium]|nr:TrkA family potassium uptake protein [Clostridia bacterium]